MPKIADASILIMATDGFEESELFGPLGILQELGAQQVETAATLSEAEQRARDGDFDIALLDVNINGQMSFQLAETLRARGVPVVFATGYELKDRAIPNLETAFCVSKPYTSERLRQALCAALAGDK